ncbi:MAG TPA: nitrite reductase large subunit NirB, partial [Labilithrix sp.]|nr:nitrite reductase large subunit NirB [Labilithrix sp.]
VAPGYAMASVLAKNLVGDEAKFSGSDMSAKLKLLGTDVASFGDPFVQPEAGRAIAIDDQVRGIYKKLVFDSEGKRILGGILVGDASDYGRLVELTRAKKDVSSELDALGIGGGAKAPVSAGEMSDDALICTCNDVRAGAIRDAVRNGELRTVADVKSCTRAGSGCGGCAPTVADLLQTELVRAGRATKPRLCEHFSFTRQELFQIVAVTRIRTFDELVKEHGSGLGCEICKPTVASILASVHNEPILDPPHRALQDTNDRFLANIQKDGTYSVVPRMPAGEVTPDQLIVLGNIAKKYALYTKITGGQRIDMFGARLEQLPDIWRELVDAGFESGHAYGKAMRTVKSCVGSTWCRYGVQDSTAFAIRIEHRYKGIRAPHKLKSAVSGCTRECAEAQSKDFGLIATERGWNVYVCGNGGTRPRHAELLAADVDEDTAIRYLDRFIMFYVRTADRLTRTSVWLDKMEGGILHLRNVIVNDSLGICAELEREMSALVVTYQCEWANVLGDEEKLEQFQSPRRVRRLPLVEPIANEARMSGEARSTRRFVPVAKVSDVPADSGIAITYGTMQIAIFNLASRGQWYATTNACSHTGASVLSRGIVGDHDGVPMVACPLHKKTFDLQTGACLSKDAPGVMTFAVKIEGDDVLVDLPPADEFRVAS